MSRDKYRRYWYPGVMDAIRNYERLGNSKREIELRKAISQAIDDTLAEDKVNKNNDGEITMQIVYLTLIRHTHTIEGAAEKIPGLSPRKATRLRIKFIYRVAEKIGY